MPTILSLLFTLSLSSPMCLPSHSTDYHSQRDAMDAASQELRLAKVDGDNERVKELTMQVYAQQIQMGRPGAALNTLRISHRWIENYGNNMECTLPSVTVRSSRFPGL